MPLLYSFQQLSYAQQCYTFFYKNNRKRPFGGFKKTFKDIFTGKKDSQEVAILGEKKGSQKEALISTDSDQYEEVVVNDDEL